MNSFVNCLRSGGGDINSNFSQQRRVVSAIFYSLMISTSLYEATIEEQLQVNRPAYLENMYRLSYILDRLIYLYLFYWFSSRHHLLRRWLHWKRSDDVNVCLVSSCGLVMAYLKLCRVDTTDLGHISKSIYLQMASTFTRIWGLSCRLILSRILSNVTEDVSELIQSDRTTSSICRLVDAIVSNVNELLVDAIFAVHCNYFIQVVAQFAGEIASATCYRLILIRVLVENIPNAYSMFLVLRSGVALSATIRQLRKKSMNAQLNNESRRNLASWTSVELILCQADRMGAKFAGDMIFTWRNICTFASFTWSFAFILLQFNLQFAMPDWDVFCRRHHLAA